MLLLAPNGFQFLYLVSSCQSQEHILLIQKKKFLNKSLVNELVPPTAAVLPAPQWTAKG